MDFRRFIGELDKQQLLTHIEKECSLDSEVANVLNALDGKTVMFEKVRGYTNKVVGGICGSRETIALGLGTNVEGIVHKMIGAINKPVKPDVVTDAPCQEVVESGVDLSKLPLPKYLSGDGGRYISSGIVIVNDKEWGRNVCYHRLMEIGKDRFVGRIIEQRGTDKALKKAGGEIDFAMCLGNSIPVLMAAATSLADEQDELAMANALEKTDTVRCKTVDIEVPANAEYVLEGRITSELVKEGPFLDLTETYDSEREQRVFQVKRITHRRDPIMQVLLPGKSEHKMLMGMPKEPTIYNEVNKVTKCRNVSVTPGGCSWLHAVVQIEKQGPNDGRKAAMAAFKGHGSLKRVIIVDDDINIFDPHDVEWALATRFQADRDSTILSYQPGSSLDPSAIYEKGQKTMTCKQGLDATIPFGEDKEEWKRVEYPKITLDEYLK